MFTGIVEAVGQIRKVQPLGNSADAGVRLLLDAGSLPLDDVQLGDSILIQGACMTVVTIDRPSRALEFDVSRESLSLTSGLGEPGEVNLERALRADTRLGGHLVSGHVDGLGIVSHFEPVGESYQLRVLAPVGIGRYLAYKGSVTINGVSLTVNSVEDRTDGCEFSINLIPHTIAVTTLKHLRAGMKVNLEVDVIARYVERMLSAASAKQFASLCPAPQKR